MNEFNIIDIALNAYRPYIESAQWLAVSIICFGVAALLLKKAWQLREDQQGLPYALSILAVLASVGGCVVYGTHGVNFVQGIVTLLFVALVLFGKSSSGKRRYRY